MFYGQSWQWVKNHRFINPAILLWYIMALYGHLKETHCMVDKCWDVISGVQDPKSLLLVHMAELVFDG